VPGVACKQISHWTLTQIKLGPYHTISSRGSSWIHCSPLEPFTIPAIPSLRVRCLRHFSSIVQYFKMLSSPHEDTRP
jgi:hypothetical protein